MDAHRNGRTTLRRAWLYAALCGAALLSGCAFSRPVLPRGGEIRLPGDIVIRQPENAATPATARIVYTVEEAAAPTLLPPLSLKEASREGDTAGRTPRRIATVDLSTGQPSVTDTTKIETTKAELASRQPLLYVGIGCIVAGLLVATLLKYPTPGGLLALCGAALIGMHSYPWLGFLAAGLGAAAAGIYIGHEIGERKVATSSTSQS